MHPYYVTTPIYYVNDRPHIGHCYSTMVADALARFERLSRGGGGDVWFLTGTDEHADKVVTSAAAHGVTPMEWADRNAAEFRAAFAFCECSNDDFIRTTEARHKDKVLGYIRELQRRGAIYLGDYEGWFDESQEEYLTETAAKEAAYKSPVTGKPLVRRTEKNYFFRLSAFQERLTAHIAANPGFIRPEGRKNEVLGRLRDGLQDIPVSRAVTSDPTSRWGIRMPDDPGHRIYVWIDALFNYLSAVDEAGPNGGLRRFWPPTVHVIAKDILWFHAVIWPCLLMALDEPLPGTVYSHAYWVREGRKMSKSLGNFVTIEVLRAYAGRYSIDAVRWYLLTQGPLGTTDTDFSHAKFVEVYNADLANGIGNCASRVANMIAKYFGNVVPDHGGRLTHTVQDLDGDATPLEIRSTFDWPRLAAGSAAEATEAAARCDLFRLAELGLAMVRQVDGFINATRPFSLAKLVDKGEASREGLGEILYQCAEAVRVASVLLTPFMPGKMGALQALWGCTPAPGATLADLCEFGGEHGLRPGATMAKGEALFMRADPLEAAPVEDAPVTPPTG